MKGSETLPPEESLMQLSDTKRQQVFSTRLLRPQYSGI